MISTFSTDAVRESKLADLICKKFTTTVAKNAKLPTMGIYLSLRSWMEKYRNVVSSKYSMMVKEA
ncbi:MAG TPA: hypothetical protein VHD83_01555 [Puia sp.]|nr:hypothetical protein [Puia sp.]